MFSQGDAQTAARESGLGIGLTLARSLVEMHGGLLQAHSDGPGLGSTFSFFLPNARSEPAGAGAAGAAANSTVLVVDGNRYAANSLAEILRLMDHRVRVAYDGPSALELVRDVAPQGIFMDLGMPGMNGYEVLKALRALSGSTQIRIAAVTGYGNEDDKKRTLDAGFDEHLTKPVDFAALQEFLYGPEPAVS